MPVPRKKLPIGIQNLSEILKGGYYYVDKTPFAHRLAEEGKYYFLSRPRRFGKSLFLDTLKELFEGNRELFKGLHAEDHWDWSRKHPVIRISFGGGSLENRDQLRQKIGEILESNATLHGVSIRQVSISGQFRALIEDTFARFKERVVILIDEYDKPILDNIENPEVAIAMREGLRDLYSVIKDADPYLHFVFFTGVSKFSKVSLFSGLNNLRDITLSREYSAICGYTEQDVDTVFAPELPGLDREQIRQWYNGYNWTGEAVYNPFDLLLLFQERVFKAHWYETGNPAFLFKLLSKHQRFLPDLQNLLVDDVLLSTFEVENIPIESLLFQAGYLTIAGQEIVSEITLYRLKYPNKEVLQSLNAGLLRDWTPAAGTSTQAQFKLYKLLEAKDLQGIGQLVSAFFESIPHQWYTNNDIARYEGYYASVFYALFASLGLDIRVEESSNAGRLDMVLRFHGQVIIFEFKLVEDGPTPGGNSALKAIEERGYAKRYLDEGIPVAAMGIEFSKTQRRVVDVLVVK